jgi:hypothetical protein
LVIDSEIWRYHDDPTDEEDWLEEAVKDRIDLYNETDIYWDCWFWVDSVLEESDHEVACYTMNGCDLKGEIICYYDSDSLPTKYSQYATYDTSSYRDSWLSDFNLKFTRIKVGAGYEEYP